MAKDPVCAMQVDEGTAAGSSTYQGETYYFCSQSCKDLIDEDPDKYIRETDILGRKIKSE